MSESTTKTALVTAVLTGVFTVAAGVTTYWLTTKSPELTYSMVGGPSLPSANGAKRIFVVEVQNTGRKEIAQTLIHLSLQSGEIGELASEASPGVKLTEDKATRQVEIRADLLNPDDSVKVSFLTAEQLSDTEPKVFVRAPGVQAIAKSTKVAGLFSKDKPSDLFAMIASALAAITSSLVLSRSRVLRKLGLPSSGPSLDQAEVCAFVCGACGLVEESERIRFGGGDISYRGTADYLKQRALSSPITQRPKYSAALRAILLNRAISANSISAIRAAIDSISALPITDEEFDELRDKAVDEGDEPNTWRTTVETFLSSLSR